jgi:hypothetical protein
MSAQYFYVLLLPSLLKQNQAPSTTIAKRGLFFDSLSQIWVIRNQKPPSIATTPWWWHLEQHHQTTTFAINENEIFLDWG